MDFFANAPIHTTSRKIYNTKLNEWLQFMPEYFNSVACIAMFPDLSLRVLQTNLKNNSPSNRHLYIVAIMSFIRHHYTELTQQLHTDAIQTARERWVAINCENEAPIVQRRLENKPTEMQMKKGGSQLSYEQIIAVRDELPVGSIERLLISMYTMIPPVRADYFATEIVSGDTAEPVMPNYIRLREDGTATVVLKDFKTVKVFKQITNELPVELIEQLRASLEKTPRSYLFLNAVGKPHTRNSFTLWARRILSKIFGTDFTLIFFRHSYSTHYTMTHDLRSMTDAQIKEISDKMGHSSEMFRAYRWIQHGGAGAANAEEDESDAEEKEE